ncbi:polymeric immunoglobulin receptor-like [Parus major]|uniref:polymeric immunoglobulin receptor-like n=1 Tax=Parus major TaxID=9157 RepID=UPI00077142F4|nr:polymeric immunoglobulin receptor-like [Parus major]
MAMELRALILLPLCFPGLQGQSPEVQRRREGDTLYFECPYTAQTEGQHTKYWCLQKGGGCQEVVYTYYGHEKKSKDGRIKIEDNTTNKTVFISMTDLKAEDSGTYFCAIYQYYNQYIPLRMVTLSVFKELLKWELDTLAVQCPNSNSVVWCRREQTDCTVLVEGQTSSRQSEIQSLQDRASIKYAQGIPTVTMEKLQSQDSGVYWCVVGSKDTQIMEVVLSVFKRTQQPTAKESGNISVQCHYKIAAYGAASKAWCKKEEGNTCSVLVTTSSEPPAGPSTAREGVRIQDDTQQGIVTITMEQLQVQDSGVYWCALQERSGLFRMEEVTLSVSKALTPGGFPDTEGKSRKILLGDSPQPSSNGNTFIILSVVLLILLLLALVTSIALGVRHYKLLGRTGHREAEDTSDRPEGTAQPGSAGKRESSQDGSQGLAYINLDVQSQPSPQDPLYCNVEPSQAHGNPQHVEYAVIAFNQSPRSGRE